MALNGWSAAAGVVDDGDGVRFRRVGAVARGVVNGDVF